VRDEPIDLANDLPTALLATAQPMSCSMRRCLRVSRNGAATEEVAHPATQGSLTSTVIERVGCCSESWRR